MEVSWNGGTPVSHPFLIGIFHYKPSIVGFLHFRKPPMENGWTWFIYRWLPSGNLTVCYWKWPFSSWIYPLKMVIFHSYVNLPECNDVTDVHDVLIGVLKLVIFIAMFITRGYVLNMVTPTTKTQKGCRMVILWRYMMINWTFIDEITYAILLINAGLYTVGI